MLTQPPEAAFRRILYWACVKWGSSPVWLENRPWPGIPSGLCFDTAKGVWESNKGEPVLVMELLQIKGFFSFALHGCNIDKKGQLFDVANYVSKTKAKRLAWLVMKPAKAKKFIMSRDNKVPDELFPNVSISADETGKLYGAIHHQHRIGSPDYEDRGFTFFEVK